MRERSERVREVKGRSAAEVAFMAAPFGLLELPKKNEVSGDFLPKHSVLVESTEVVLSVCQL